MQPITQTVQISLEAANKLMAIVSKIISNPKMHEEIYPENLEHARWFCDLVENASRLSINISKVMRFGDGLMHDPVPTVTIHSDVAISIAYLVNKYAAS